MNNSFNDSEIQGIDLDTFTTEEREEIYGEMEQVFSDSNLNQEQQKKFDISRVPKGIKLPLAFNICVLFSLILVLIIIFVINSRQTITDNAEDFDSLSSGRKDIAQKIILDLRESIVEKSDSLDDLNTQREVLLLEKTQLISDYESEIARYKALLESDINTQLAELRGELQQENLTEKEITRRLAILEKELRVEYERKLVEYTKQLQKDITEKQTKYDAQIDSINSQYTQKERDVMSLQTKLGVVASQVDSDATVELQDEVRAALTEAETALLDLQTEQSEEEKAQGVFDLHHQKIIGFIKDNKLDEAEIAINEAIKTIKNSVYADSEMVNSYLSAYATYKTVISTQLDLNKRFEEVGIENAIDYEQLLQNFNALEQTYTTLEQEFEERSSKAIAQSVSKAKKSSIKDTLDNIRLIIAYLELKKAGIEDTYNKAILDNAINRAQYDGVINDLIRIIDRSRSITF